MKIAFCAPADLHALARFCGKGLENVPPGLGSTATTPLMIELLRRGHEVTLFTTDRSIVRPLSFDGDRLHIRIAPARARHTGRDLFAAEVAGLKQLMLAERCDLIHAHWTYEFALAALGTGIPTITTIHDLPWRVLKYFRDPYRAARLVMAYQVARKGKFFSAVSPDAAKHFKQFLRPKGTIDVIPNYMPEPVFELGKAAKQQSDRPLVFATMLQGWSKRKNAECALVAYQQVRQSFPESRLLMFGADYEDKGAAHRWAAVRGLCDGVEFKGPMEYSRLLPLVVESVDVLVHPSLDEACSMTILECMALRKPVIAGIRTPGIRFELDEGRAGLLVDARSPNAIATAMRRLASDARLRQSLADSAYEYARKTFTADAVVSQYEALYKKVLHNREGKLCY